MGMLINFLNALTQKYVEVSQDNPFPTQLSDSALQANPYNTPEGQMTVSVRESFEAKLWAEGRPVNGIGNGVTLTASTEITVATLTASPGCELYPFRICISTDVDSLVQVQYLTQMVDAGNAGTLYDIIFLKAGTPLVLKLSGETRVFEYGTVKITATATGAGKGYASINGIEVTNNA